MIKNKITEKSIGFFIKAFIDPDSNQYTGIIHSGIFYPKPFILKSKNQEIYILGTPIIDKLINRSKLATHIPHPYL